MSRYDAMWCLKKMQVRLETHYQGPVKSLERLNTLISLEVFNAHDTRLTNQDATPSGINRALATWGTAWAETVGTRRFRWDQFAWFSDSLFVLYSLLYLHFFIHELITIIIAADLLLLLLLLQITSPATWMTVYALLTCASLEFASLAQGRCATDWAFDWHILNPYQTRKSCITTPESASAFHTWALLLIRVLLTVYYYPTSELTSCQVTYSCIFQGYLWVWGQSIPE